ncbi:uncharacterized protein ColSpa_09304 [Colletotrichum spaethianum]|uniref:C2H2-type domain-containing protein n=1 Tax=Colletotrichum spaethianum TaxID=700344 RepID=A0AA37PBD9_9PEZI|nr:uncharacterized protein ColSpa_09304 [Colletotrichum spaethianum]GKT49123.1 hypothetical protein ColSpa_09304 [Colletotrichum spaethianum]
MASLQDIMNVDEDQLESHTIKNKQVPALSGSHHQSYLAPNAAYNSSYAIGREPADNSSTQQGTKRSSPSHTTKSTPPGSSSSSSRPPNARRRSNVSTDSMEQSNYGYGHAGSPSGQSMRHFGQAPAGGDVPIKLTPITGRVSRAKKGMKVHTCDICRPPKLSHETPQYACPVPGCDRAFHRKDLLERHQQRQYVWSSKNECERV